MSGFWKPWRNRGTLGKLAACLTVLGSLLQTEPVAAAEVGRGTSDELAGPQAEVAPFVPGFDRFARHELLSDAWAGRLLVSELSCTACHATDNATLLPKRGPDLKGVGDRIDQAWLRRFLADPAQIKPGTTMPNCFAGMPEHQKRDAIAALTAFLSTQHQSFPEIRATGANPVPYRFWEKGRIERGEMLYHQVGCVACHAPDAEYEVATIKTSQFDKLLEQLSDEELEELGFASAARPVRSVPLPDLDAKYTSESLTHFLLAPEKVRPSGRMPNFQLNAVDAADIAAYLLRKDAATADAPLGTEPARPVEALRDEGQRLFTRLGCAQCHRAGQEPAAPQATPLAELDWTAEDRCDLATPGPQPYFPLDSRQSTALRAATADASDGVETNADAHAARFPMLQLNCFACHTRDGLGGVGRNRRVYFETVGNVDLGDEGRLPPPLTGVGRKLTSRWIQQVLNGDGVVRPHLQIRMPKYPPAMVAPLSERLAAADLPHPETPSPSEAQVFAAGEEVDAAKLAEAGRRLLDTGCVQCHPVQGEALPGVVGVDLGSVTGRLRPAWFRDFILDPGSLKPRTRMPTFFPAGKSQDPSLLEGDAEKQIAALWAYLKRSQSLPLPGKIQEARSQDFELKPTTKPLLLRTFMKHAGTHAIAVGFPQSVHYAFDAETNRLAVLWRGGFIDAQGTWFVRFAPPADPLGEAVMLPKDFPFAMLDTPPGDRPWPSPAGSPATFRGYRIDSDGVPTLLYHWKGWEIEDRLVPGRDQGLERTLILHGGRGPDPKATLWFRAHVGEQLSAPDEAARTDPQGLTVRLPARWAAAAIERTRVEKEDRQTTAWLVPLRASAATAPGPDKNQVITIKVRYEW